MRWKLSEVRCNCEMIDGVSVFWFLDACDICFACFVLEQHQAFCNELKIQTGGSRQHKDTWREYIPFNDSHVKPTMRWFLHRANYYLPSFELVEWKWINFRFPSKSQRTRPCMVCLVSWSLSNCHNNSNSSMNMVFSCFSCNVKMFR